MKQSYTFVKQVFKFYIQGFKTMTWGKTLWIIIIIKLFVMFAILRPFFFQPQLEGSQEERAQRVGERLSIPAE